jgi:hypothetical protein
MGLGDSQHILLAIYCFLQIVYFTGINKERLISAWIGYARVPVDGRRLYFGGQKNYAAHHALAEAEGLRRVGAGRPERFLFNNLPSNQS